MDVSEDVWGKTVQIKMKHSSDGNYKARVSFLNEQGQVLRYIECSKCTATQNVVVPKNAKKLAVSSNGGNVYIYEIKLK